MRDRLGRRSAPARRPGDQRVRRRGPRRARRPPGPPDPTSGSGCSTTTATPPRTRSSSCSPPPPTNPSVDLLGPKLREWPSLRRLLEVGVTISGTGRRETGLERGEYDQGQHDRIRDVLAVNTAGMLVRRSVLETLGFDQPAAAVRQRRRPRLAGRPRRPPHRRGPRRGRLPRRGRAPRRPAAPDRPARLPARRAGRRALHAAGQRLAAGAAVHGGAAVPRQPGARARPAAGAGPRRGRSTSSPAWSRRTCGPGGSSPAAAPRRRARRSRAREVRHLLAPPWMPYRHGLDFVSDIATAVAHQAGDVAAARRARTPRRPPRRPGRSRTRRRTSRRTPGCWPGW